MDSLLIEGHRDAFNVPALLRCNATRRLIEISGEVHRFSAEEVRPFATWIDHYAKEHTAPLRLHYTPSGKGFPLTLSYFPVLPREEWHFSTVYYDKVKQEHIAQILAKLPSFSLHIESTWQHPQIHCDVEQGLICISGEFYSSYTLETMAPVWSWLERYLSVNGRQIRLEFWMDYFNTVASQQFMELIDVLATYRQAHGGNVGVYWYCEEGNYDMIDLAAYYQEGAPLPVQLKLLSSEQWRERKAKG